VWMTPRLKLLIDRRDRAFHLKNWSKYHRLKEEVIALTRALKSQCIKRAVSSGDVRRVWRTIKTIGRQGVPTSRRSLQINADNFSDFFSSVFQNNDSVIHCDTESGAVVPTFSVFDIFVELKKLKRKSSGPDEIPFWIFRDFAWLLSPAITSLFNQCIAHGKVPVCFKKAKVIPIPKCRHPKTVSDFRPISLLPLLSKVFEKMISRMLILPHVAKSVDPAQFAFFPGPGSGTASALTLISDRILSFLDSTSGAVRLLSIDFSKAFDKASHNAIFSAICKFKLPACAVKLVMSFLQNRVQSVSWNGQFSKWSPIPSGVPQGSVLGPILFGLIVDNFFPVCENSRVVKYADDITILHFVRTSSDDNLQEEWNNCVNWASVNKLPLNIAKCKILNIVTKKNLLLSNVLSSTGFLPEVDELKLLGVTFSSNLKWNTHVNSIVAKASRRIFIVRNLKRSDCSPALIFRAYVAFIRSVLLYAYSSFCNLSFYLQDLLVKVEKRVLRIIDSDVDFPDLLTVADRSCFNFLRSIEKCENHPLRIMFECQHRTQTRSSNVFRPPLCKTKRFHNSFIKYCMRQS
ncbi:MAG: reverse transcriptase family protein, partial [Pseudomonadota bacterium]